uniref:Probable RNA polymerase II nuclear localization protein SLC7A6OS n=1 Tax=Culex pipiens TaxID=7175 RepID=A0A8D8D774_CULPI
MAAVIRLKRRVDEDPLNAFVLNCKRQRTDQAEPDAATANGVATTPAETSTVLKFAGTFTKADNIPAHLQSRLSKEEAKEAISRVHRPTIASRNRLASRQTTQNSRFRIVNCTRSLSQVEGEEVGGGTTIVDVERDQVAGAPAQEQEPGFVYDLYVVDESQQQSQHVPYIPENLDDISVAIYDDPLYSSHRGLGDRSDSDGGESEDSNDENNWRNDYPDEDEDVFGEAASVDEDDIRRAVEEFDLDGDRDLSSDEDYYEAENSGFAYPADDDGECDNGEEGPHARLNKQDVELYGTAYARYKARILKDMKAKESNGDRDSDEYDSEIECDDDSKSSGTSDSDNENFDLYD